MGRKIIISFILIVNKKKRKEEKNKGDESLELHILHLHP